MKGKILKLCMLVITIAMASACTAGASKKATTTKAGTHPELSAQEKLTPCAQCHKDATPEVYKEWFDSVHGIAKVKCYQCHGTYEELKTSPDETHCAACHNAQYQKRPSDRKCWDCHPAHRFFIHK